MNYKSKVLFVCVAATALVVLFSCRKTKPVTPPFTPKIYTSKLSGTRAFLGTGADVSISAVYELSGDFRIDVINDSTIVFNCDTAYPFTHIHDTIQYESYDRKI